jgi:O-antigen/teichoic acid export membrane protein
MRHLQKRTFVGLIWEGSGKILQKISSQLVLFILFKLLVPTDFGLMAAALILVGLLEFVNELGIGGAIVQREEIDTNSIHTLFWLCAGVGTTLTLLLWFGAPTFVNLYYINKADLNIRLLTQIIRVLSLNMLIISLRVVPLSLLSRQLRFRERATSMALSTIGAGATAITVAAMGGGVWALVTQLLTFNLLQVFLFTYHTRYLPKFIFQWSRDMNAMLQYGLKVTGSRMLFYLQSVGDLLIATRYFDTVQVGRYSFGSQIGITPVNTIATVINPVFFPVFSRIQSDLDRLKLYFLTVTKYISLMAFPALAGLCLVAREDYISAALRPEWGPAAPILRILASIGLLRSMAFVLPSVLNARGRPGLTLLYNTFAAVVLPVSFFLAKDGGPVAMAKMWFLAYPPVFLLVLVFALREMRLSALKYIYNLGPAGLSTLGMTGMVYAFQRLTVSWSPLVQLLCVIGVGIVSYLALLFFFFPNCFEEFKNVIRILRSPESPEISEDTLDASSGDDAS